MPEYNLPLSHQALFLRLHIITVYLSYIVFFAASVAAVLYLVQNHALKNKQAGIIFSRLPGLSFLDKLNYRSIGLGFPILTFSILSGFIWAENIHGIYWSSYNSRQIYAIVLWLIYAVTLHVRLSAKLRGKKVALLTLSAFLVMILSLLGTCH